MAMIAERRPGLLPIDSLTIVWRMMDSRRGRVVALTGVVLGRAGRLPRGLGAGRLISYGEGVRESIGREEDDEEADSEEWRGS